MKSLSKYTMLQISLKIKLQVTYYAVKHKLTVNNFCSKKQVKRKEEGKGNLLPHEVDLFWLVNAFSTPEMFLVLQGVSKGSLSFLPLPTNTSSKRSRKFDQRQAIIAQGLH